MWKMQMCLAPEKPVFNHTFESLEDGKDWLRRNVPHMLDRHRLRIERNGFVQYGTGFYWASFERVD